MEGLFPETPNTISRSIMTGSAYSARLAAITFTYRDFDHILRQKYKAVVVCVI